MPTKISALPLYSQYFLPAFTEEIKEPFSPSDWERLNSTKEDFTSSLSSRPADFSFDNRTWKDTGKNIASVVLKTALLTCTFYLYARSNTQRVIRWIPNFLQNQAAAFLQKDMVAELLAKYAITSFNRAHLETAQRMGAFALKLFLSFWMIHSSLRYIVQRFIMLPLYPAQSRLVKLFVSAFRTDTQNGERTSISRDLIQQGFILRDVVLEKNGIRYSGLLIGHKDTINNGKWALQATGNGEPIDYSAADFAGIYYQFHFNLLLINGPSVGKSQGQATPASMGDAQEIGLTFIETALKASKIVIAGRSLGGAAIGQAILSHQFKDGVKYLVIRQMTFDRASNICGKIVGQLISSLEKLVERVVQWSGCEMDLVDASRRLQELGIKEVIVQASHQEIEDGKLPTIEDIITDGLIIAQASLAHALIDENITGNKVFYCLANAHHMTNNAISAAKKEINEM